MNAVASPKPLQARSRLTQEKLLNALEKLLATQSIHELTVNQIAAEAGVTTGAIYRRFKDKRALLQAAFERFHNEAATAKALDTLPPGSDQEAIRQALRGVLGYALDHMPLMRAAAAYDDEFSYGLMRTSRDEVAESLARHISSSSYSRAELSRRTRFVLRAATAVMRDTYMSGPGAYDATLTRRQFEHRHRAVIDRLIEDLAEMAAGYLGITNN